MTHFLDDVLVALSGRDDLVDPARERMRSRCGNLQAGAFRGGHQLSPRAMHLNAQIADTVADARARLHDGLVQLGLDLFGYVRRCLRNELGDVRTQLAGRRINDLKFFFDADGEAVSHALAIRMTRPYRGL